MPNSIVIERGAFSYFLTSFLSRNAAYDLIIRLRDKRLGDSSRWGHRRWGRAGQVHGRVRTTRCELR